MHVDTEAILDVPCFSERGVPKKHDDPKLQTALIEALWPCTKQSPIELDNFRAYFQFLSRECNETRPFAHAASTFLDLMQILDIMKSSPNSSMVQLRLNVRNLGQRFVAIDDQKISASIELAVRLCYMINVRNVMPSETLSLRTALPWPEQQSLKQVLENIRWQIMSSCQESRQEFPTVPELVRIGGMTVRWTDDILNHLKLDCRTLYLFKHVSVLQYQYSSGTEHVLSDDLILETLRSFDLILPATNPKCNGWMSRIIDAEHIDPNINCPLVNVEPAYNFYYWNTRLNYLAEVFDKTFPTTLYQLWYDRRDMARWWTFCSVILSLWLTVLFGLIQSIAGIIQVIESKGY